MKYLFAAPATVLAVASPAFAEALEGKPTSAEILESAAPSDWRALEPEETLYIELERGRVVVALSTQLAKRHVAQIKKLAREGFYDGLSFYRVIDGFVAQGGDVLEKRNVKTAARRLKAEFDEPAKKIAFSPIADADGYAAQVGFVDSLPAGIDAEGDRIWHLHCVGAMAMARGNETDSAGTEFYIALQPQRYLDRNLTVFGRVVDGMEHLQALRRVAPAQSEADDLGETILSVSVGADLPEEKQLKLEILRSGTETFGDYVEARRNRSEAFFYHRPDYVDICQLSMPVRVIREDQE